MVRPSPTPVAEENGYRLSESVNTMGSATKASITSTPGAVSQYGSRSARAGSFMPRLAGAARHDARMACRPGKAHLVTFGRLRQTDVGLGDLQEAERRIDLEQPVVAEEYACRNAAAHQCAGGGKFQLFRPHDVVDLPGGAAFAARQAVTVCLDHVRRRCAPRSRWPCPGRWTRNGRWGSRTSRRGVPPVR